MSTTTILQSTDRLLDAVAGRLVSPSNDYSHYTIVFPGKRPAHHLRKILAERVQSSYIPPCIYTIDQFVEHLAFGLLGCKQRKLDVANALAVLYHLHLEMDERLGGVSYATLDEFIPVGMKLIGELEELAMAQLSPDDVRNGVAAFPYRIYQTLPVYFEQFYERTGRANFISRAMMYRFTARQLRDINPGEQTTLLMVGMTALTKVERDIMDILRERENVEFISQYGTGSDNHSGTEWNSGQDPVPSSQASPTVNFIAAPDIHGQVFALAALLQQQVEQGGSADHRTAIVLPTSDALFPLYHHALSLLPEKGYNIALGYPITRTPAYGFLESLMNVVEGEFEGAYASGEYLKFMLHPYVKNIRMGGRTDITRIMMHKIEEYLARRGFVQVSFSAIEQDDELLERIHVQCSRIDEACTPAMLREHLASIHAQTIGKFTAFTSIRDCALRTKEVLLYMARESTAPRHPYFLPYIERFLEILDELSSSLLASEAFPASSAYFGFLRHLLDSEVVPFPGTPLQGVQVLGLLETRNLSFETIYLLDVNDDVVPGRPEADLLLPDQLRRQLGLETYREREQLIEYYFNLAIQSARKVTIFYSDSGGSERSRFVEKLLWQYERKAGHPGIKNAILPVKYKVFLDHAKPGPVKKTPETLRWLRRSFKCHASALDTYTACQLRFYYRYVLRLDERDEATDDLDSPLVGTVVHDILAALYAPGIGKQLDASMLTLSRLHNVAEEKFRQRFGTAQTGRILLFKKKTLDHLRDFVEKYQLPLLEREQAYLIALERKFEVEVRGFSFSGRVDRIERRGQKTFILDYKTGGDVSAK